MDLDDIFEQKHNSRNQHYDHNYRHEDDHGHQNNYNHENEYRHGNEHNSSHAYDKQNDLKNMMLEKLRNNPSFRKLVITGSIVLIIIAAALLFLLFPLILKLVGYVGENGVEGSLNTIWKGTK